MCGIAGYVGGQNAPEILFDMLARLEYRGYDSAGVAFRAGERIEIPKATGRVADVRAAVKPETKSSHIGVGHTRWATHGIPSNLNAHPHADCTGTIAVAHNGIIENYQSLKVELEERGHRFASETDTEVIAHLLEEYHRDNTFLEAFRQTLLRLEGSFAVTAICAVEPGVILVARKESPLIIGVGEREHFIASDLPAILPYTKRVAILEDYDYGVIRKESFEIMNLLTGSRVDKAVEESAWDVSAAEKGGFHHFMLKEIHEEPDAVRNALREKSTIADVAKTHHHLPRIYFVACGTASYVGLVGKYVLEHYGIASEAVAASEFRYSTSNTIDDDCLVVAISQSGETADTLAAVKEAKKRGATAIAIVNAQGSSLSRDADACIGINAGPEIAVASTKAYVGQVVSTILLGLELAAQRGTCPASERDSLHAQIEVLPEKIQSILEDGAIRRLAEHHAKSQTFFYIGRGVNYPTALEGALKIKEISYLHAEAYPAGELKHGPLALLEAGLPVICIMPTDGLQAKMSANVKEVQARSADAITLGPGQRIDVPETHPLLSPVVNIVPLHLFAYHIAVLRGHDVDKPRNLAKSVTVE